jgi:hypothetical protein
LFAYVHFRTMKLPMPPQHRIGCHDSGDLTQDLPSQLMSPDGKSSPLGIGELQPPLTPAAVEGPDSLRSNPQQPAAPVDPTSR